MTTGFKSYAQTQQKLNAPGKSFILSLLYNLSAEKILKYLWNQLTALLFFRLRLIPLVIFFAVLVLGVRVTTFFGHVKQGDFIQNAIAADAKDTREKPLSPNDTKDEGTKTPSQDKNTIKALDEFDPFNMTADQYKALKGVANQTSHLADKDRAISEKEQVLNALIKKMDAKVQELNKAKAELKGLVDKIDEEENANTERLVKMVEAMKPTEAAKVLEGMEFPIMLEIMEKMKEKKASAILASMEANKASYLMTALSKRRKVYKKDAPDKGVMQG